VAVGRILVFGGLASIFAGLEFAGLLNWQRFVAKRSGYASRKFGGPTPVRRCGIRPASGGIDPQNMPLFLPPLRKMKLKLNGWLAKGSARTNQYFSGLI
jgi:hypothetical protein